jgi:hypothetical protein
VKDWLVQKQTKNLPIAVPGGICVMPAPVIKTPAPVPQPPQTNAPESKAQ